MIIWCVAISVVYGLLVLIPESYGSDDDTTVLLTLMCISLATIPAVFINMAFVESEKLGRKWTIIIFLGI